LVRQRGSRAGAAVPLLFVAELRTLLCGAPDVKWMLPCHTALTRGTTTATASVRQRHGGSAARAARRQCGKGGAATEHVAMVVASRAAHGDGANIQMLCTVTSGCCATAAAAAATSHGGGRGS
jgi:hypothetical protein